MTRRPENVDEARRQFLRGGAALTAAIVAPGITLYAFDAQAAASSKVRWGMLIDTSKCKDGCNACVAACNKENGLKDTGHPATDAQWIRKVSVRDPKTGAARSLPVMCQHCSSPPCVDVCPTGASFKRPDGIVLVDRHICIGCRYCMMACPYKARSFVHEDITDQKANAPRGKGTVEGCNMCVTRIDAGKPPVCVEACASEGAAMLFGDLNDPKSAIAKRLAELPSEQIRADLGTDPGVRYSRL